MRNYLELGSWNVICDRCGLKYKSHQLKSEWTGIKVCKHCWELRHPQTLIQSRDEVISTRWTRPEPEELFIIVPNPIVTEFMEYLLTEVEVPIHTET